MRPKTPGRSFKIDTDVSLFALCTSSIIKLWYSRKSTHRIFAIHSCVHNSQLTCCVTRKLNHQLHIIVAGQDSKQIALKNTRTNFSSVSCATCVCVIAKYSFLQGDMDKVCTKTTNDRLTEDDHDNED